MLYAILSDIHGNPSALEAALEDARAQGAEKIVCLGDVVGYGPDAVRAVELARASCDEVLMGNHDAATAGVIPFDNFRPEAQVGVRRHAKELSPEALEWLRKRPYTYRGRTFLCAHGTLYRPEEFGYIFAQEDAEAAYAEMGGMRLLFVGHTHASMWVVRNPQGFIRAGRSERMRLYPDHQYIVNVGSVGYPRCECESVYALYETRTRVVTWRRLPFDFDSYFTEMQAKNIYVAPWLKDRAKEKERKNADTRN